MSIEKTPNQEGYGPAIKELIKQLGILNIDANFEDDGEEPKLVTLDGALTTMDIAGGDEEIEFMVSRIQNQFPNLHFTYTREGVISVSSKEPTIH